MDNNGTDERAFCLDDEEGPLGLARMVEEEEGEDARDSYKERNWCGAGVTVQGQTLMVR